MMTLNSFRHISKEDVCVLGLGKYWALVDGSDRVAGSTFSVQSKEQEDALRLYETDKYEVVKCTIHTEQGPRDGYTFLFAGPWEELD